MHLATRRFAFLALVGLLLTGPTLLAEADADLLEKQARQRQIQAETDRMVREMQTTIRILQYYQLDKSEEQTMLEEAARMLSQLSQDQMAEVIARLEKAAKAPTQEQAESEKAVAYAKHREIVTTLRTLTGRRNLVQSLEEAIVRLEESASKQRDLYLTAGPIVRMLIEPKLMKRDSNDARGRFQERTASRDSQNILRLLADHQTDLWKDVRTLLEEQLPALEPSLSVAQKDRMSRAITLAESFRFQESFEIVSKYLMGGSWFASIRNPKYEQAVRLQWKISGDLKKVAHALRAEQDRLGELRSAKYQLDEAIALQNSLQGQTEKLEENTPNSQLMLQQGRLARETQDLQNRIDSLLESDTTPVAESVNEMLAAEKELQRMKPKQAAELQKKAEASLEKARKQIESAIADEEKKRSDPKAALEGAIDSLDKLIGKQNETQNRTDQFVREEKPEELAELSPQQRDLAKALARVERQPMPPGTEQADASLQRARQAMQEATEALSEQKGPDAQRHQSQAVEQMEQAKQAMQEQVAQIEKRREEIAALEEANQELAKLLAEEQRVSDELQALQDGLTAKDLEKLAQDLQQRAKGQDGLSPQAEELTEKLAQELASERAKLAESKDPQQLERLGRQLEKLAQERVPLTPREEDLAKKLAGELTPEMAEQFDAKDPKQLEQFGKELEKLAREKDELSPLSDLLTKKLTEELANKAAQQFDAKDRKDLEQLAKDLDKLAKKRQDLPPQAEELAKKLAKEFDPEALTRDRTDPKEREKLAKELQRLAQEQGELSPLTEELAKKLAEDLAPEAAKMLEASKENMQSAQKALQERSPEPARQQADEASRRLEDAMKDLAKNLDEKKLKELLDQAALNPEEVSPSKAAQQVAKALEELEDAENLSQEASEQLMEQLRQLREQGRLPKEAQRGELAKLQRELAKQADNLELKDASLLAKEAARALERGDFRQAMQEQYDALEELEQATNRQQGEPMRRPLTPEQLQQARELASTQQKLLRSTQTLSRSDDATAAALAALAQAQAQAPPAVQARLEKALRDLARASDQLRDGSPESATEAQRQAMRELRDALRDLNMTAEAMGQQRARPGQAPNPVAKNPQPAPPEPTEQPSPERNEGRIDRGRIPDGRTSNSASRLVDVQGEGAFIHLPPRQRDLVRQALGQNLPPEYAAMIQQYYLNIANGQGSAPRP